MQPPPFQPHELGNLGPTELVLIVIVPGLLVVGLFFFLKGLLGMRMTVALIVVAVTAAALWAVSPLFGVVTLVLGIPLTVGIVRALGDKRPKRGG